MVVYERGEHLRLEEPGEEGEVRLLLVGEERSLVEVLQREISGISGKVQIMLINVLACTVSLCCGVMEARSASEATITKCSNERNMCAKRLQNT